MKTALIVEDESIISFGYRLQLEQLGFEVIDTVGSGDEAESVIARQQPDLLIMDVYLTGDRNGLETAQDIRAKADIPIIFLTASSKPEIVAGIRAMDNCHYLIKPVDTEAFNDLLHNIGSRP